MEARKVETDNGWLWIKEGLVIYMKHPLLWTVLSTFTVFSLMSIASLPIIGDPLASLLMPVLLAGFMLGCDAVKQGKEFGLAHVFAGFKEHPHQLVTLGGINFVALMLIMGAMKLTGGEKLVEMVMNGVQVDDPNIAAQVIADAGISIVVGMSMYTVLVMAMQFAPALVLFNKAAPLAALKSSLQACLRNIMPLSVYGAIMMMFALVATLFTFMLGWLVLLPLMITSTYAAYRDLYPALEESGNADEGKVLPRDDQEQF